MASSSAHAAASATLGELRGAGSSGVEASLRFDRARTAGGAPAQVSSRGRVHETMELAPGWEGPRLGSPRLSARAPNTSRARGERVAPPPPEEWRRPPELPSFWQSMKTQLARMGYYLGRPLVIVGALLFLIGVINASAGLMIGGAAGSILGYLFSFLGASSRRRRR